MNMKHYGRIDHYFMKSKTKALFERAFFIKKNNYGSS